MPTAFHGSRTSFPIMGRVLAPSVTIMLLSVVATLGLAYAATAASPPALEGRWITLPDAPWGSLRPAAVWTGESMLVVDLPTGRTLSYDPEARRWTQHPSAPEPLEWRSPSVWTGEELIILDRYVPERGYAFDAAAGTWRALAPSPLPEQEFAVWADGAVVVAGIDEEDGVQSRAMARYDPVSDTWTSLPPAPGSDQLEGLHSTGTEVLAVTTDRDVGPVQVAALDLVSDTWGAAVPGPVSPFAAGAIWTGDRLLFSSPESYPEGVSDATFDPATSTWHVEDIDCRLFGGRSVRAGGLVVSEYPDAALDPASEVCYRLVRGRRWKTYVDNGLVDPNPPVWTGRELIFWSGAYDDPLPEVTGGVAFVPAAPGAAADVPA